MEVEEIFINLKVLETLDKNQKLISRGPYLNIEPISIIPEALRRWHRQDNRHETLKKINLIVNSAIEFICKYEKDNSNKSFNDLSSSDEPQQNDATVLLNPKPKSGHEMRIYLENSLKGIKNLKETYATCSQTCARIDVVVNKIYHVLGYAI